MKVINIRVLNFPGKGIANAIYYRLNVDGTISQRVSDDKGILFPVVTEQSFLTARQTTERIEALEQSTDGLLNGSDFEAYYILSRDN
jgi:hypothetical protein